MDDVLRQRFDAQLERVLAELPERVRKLLEQVPLVVDDWPSPRLMRLLGVRRRDALCGLYMGVPLTSKSISDSGQPSDVIRLFRLGIMAEARDRRGQVSDEELRRQIRLTILHEFGHYHGLDEQELEELGY